ncbi:CGNR zinc finger domain-containing protein [Actinokineospora sp.]|uniref:CGNR zinc finger domain-containing protein n=1 Tax=Actinokineospora sp. TaxID=1872133 RepID=UPI0040382840
MRVLTSPTGTTYSFDPGSFCLELLLTGGPGPYQRYEILHAPADLVAWLRDSRLAEIAPLGEVRVRQAELARVKHFRDTLWRLARAVAAGDTLDSDGLAVLNAAAEAPPRPRVDPETGVRGWAGPITGTHVLGAAAREAIDLVATDLAARVRECAADDCQLMFLDTSRPGTRRWCSMRRCGNRHKVGVYRGRG